MTQLTSTIVGRMAERSQNRSYTPDIPDDWEHVEAPGRPQRTHSDDIRSQSQAKRAQIEYQEKWRAWHVRDVKTRIEQWSERS